MKGLNSKGDGTRVKLRKKFKSELQGAHHGHTANGMRGADGEIKLSPGRTKIILEPTLKQSENPLDTKNPQVAPGDMPPKKGGQTVRQVREDLINLSERAIQRYNKKRAQVRTSDDLGYSTVYGEAALKKWSGTEKISKPSLSTAPKRSPRSLKSSFSIAG